MLELVLRRRRRSVSWVSIEYPQHSLGRFIGRGISYMIVAVFLPFVDMHELQPVLRKCAAAPAPASAHE